MRLLKQQVHTSLDISTNSGDRTMLYFLQYTARGYEIAIPREYTYVEDSSSKDLEIMFTSSMPKVNLQRNSGGPKTPSYVVQ